jgi:predicted ATP-grasp superfamily ATP-dependent carboligase
VPARPNLLIFGASTRAAVFSALRAGLRPWCADLFADADLEARCAVWRVPFAAYPQRFLEIIGRDLPGPWMYTGALESWRLLVAEMARLRPLWGNDEGALVLSRAPWFVASLLHEAGIPHPALWLGFGQPPRHERWLVKRVAGAGGSGIRFWDGARLPKPPRRKLCLQKYVEGTPAAAVYVGDGTRARLLGATEQLVGEPCLHAAPFHYCGSIGPMPLEPPLRWALERLGNVLVSGCVLRGLFGVDFILNDGIPWPVEVNPRYTASVEVLEYAAGIPALALHRQVFDPTDPAPSIPPAEEGFFLGKAILFAREALTFPEDGPWQPVLRDLRPVSEAPPFADVPHAGQRIDAGRPVLTFFARGDSPAACRDALQEIAADLDCRLFGR